MGRTNKGVSYVPLPLVEGSHLLKVSDSGVAHCFDAQSGTIEGEKRMCEHQASLTSAEGQIFIRTDKSLICLGKRVAKTVAR